MVGVHISLAKRRNSGVAKVYITVSNRKIPPSATYVVLPAFDYCEFWAADCDDNREINVCDVQIGINKALE